MEEELTDYEKIYNKKLEKLIKKADEYEIFLENKKKEIYKTLQSHSIGGKDGLNRDIKYIKEEYFNKVCDSLMKLIYEKNL